MVEAQPIYAPNLPEGVPGKPRRVVQIRNIPLPIAETIHEIVVKRNQRPDDVAALAILHLKFFADQEMNGGRILVKTDGQNLLEREDIVRELDFGFTGPEHQGFKGKLRRFLMRHHII